MRMVKISVLSVSLLTIMTGAAVSPVLAEIARDFNSSGGTGIKLILTIPALIIIPTSYLTGRYCHLFSRKQILMTGLIIYILGGAGGSLSTSLNMLYLFRAVLGAGAGIVIPVSTGIIADLFKGDERTEMMGYSTAASSLGGVLATSASGFLAVLSWRYSFTVYLIGLVVLILNMIWLPPRKPSGNGKSCLGRVPLKVFFWGMGVFAIMLLFYSIPTNIAIYMKAGGIGGPDKAGSALSIQIAIGFLAGVVLKQSRKILGRYLLSTALLFFSLGFLGLSVSTTYSGAVFSMMAVGSGLGTMIPVFFLKATHAGGRGKGVTSMSVVISLSFLGQFLSPLVLDYIFAMTGISEAGGLFFLIGTAASLTALTCMGYLVLKKKMP